LLIGAGLLMRSFIRLRGVNPACSRPACDPSACVGRGAECRAGAAVAFFRQVTDRIATLPGVRAVGAVNVLPLTGLGMGSNFAVEGARAQPEQRPLGSCVRSRPRTSAPWDSSGAGALWPIPIPRNRPRDRGQPDAGARSAGRQRHRGRVASIRFAGRVAEIVGVVGDGEAGPHGWRGMAHPHHPYPQGPSAAMTLTGAPPDPAFPGLGRDRRGASARPDQPWRTCAMKKS